MTRELHSVEIERLVLVDVNLPAAKAEALRIAVQSEAARLLDRSRWQTPESARIDRVEAPGIALGRERNASTLAAGLARSIVQGVLEAGSAPGGSGDG